MSFWRKILHIGPSIQQQHVDAWLADRESAMAKYHERRRSGLSFDDALNEYGPMLRNEQFVRDWERKDEAERVQKLKAKLSERSQFARLRMRRGLPFRSRRAL